MAPRGSTPPLDTDMTGRVALVTGATDGHGRAMAKLLAERGAEVVVHARSREKAERVCDEIASETGAATGKRSSTVNRLLFSTTTSPRSGSRRKIPPPGH